MASDVAKVLVVDDDQLLREFYARVFANMGYEAVCAGDGDEAIMLLRESREPFALIIMDLLMPVKTGWETMAFIRGRQEWRNVPIVAITGLAVSSEEMARMRQYCDDIILKGEFGMSRLSETVERLIGRPGPEPDAGPRG
ncbi:MAG: Polar-differentiation response regulator DivK [Lentisphaerae bacterium ADurb.BinA184]|nr:MAG: Polar-differentiation response regulator DivK [Lentisphaerae bacterium ADurb.BinA184]